MRLSPAQRQLVKALFTAMPTEPQTRGDEAAQHDAAPRDVLAGLHRDDFLRTLETATVEAERAAALARHLATWVARLIPLLDREPTMTLEEALDRYLRTRAPRP